MKLRLIVIAYILTVLCTSCDDFLDHPVSGAITDDNIGEVLTNDPSQIASFLEGAYRKLGKLDMYGRYMYYSLPEMAHEVDMDYISTQGWNEFAKNDLTSSNSFVLGYYKYFYRIIYAANLTVDLVNKMDISQLSPTTVNEINNYKGEALFLRAFSNFMLLQFFGEKGPRVGGVYPNNKDAQGIILMQELTTAETAYAARSTVGQCYEAIIADLEAAESVIGDDQIPANHVVRTPGSADTDYTKDYGWAQKPAVIALLGKVYLYMNDFENAKQEFEKILSDSRFALDIPVNFTDYIQHTDNNAECIFSLQYYDSDRADVYAEDPIQSVPRIMTNVPNAWKNTFIDAQTYARFGSDPRLYEATLYDVTWSEWSTNTSGPVWTTLDPTASDFRGYPRKTVDFYDYSSPRDATKNIDIIRLADVYLMYAEANLQLGNTSLATEYVNKVRRRAWDEADYNSPATKGEDFASVDLSIIQEERYKELFFENIRWFDLCRWQILESELAKYPTTNAGVVTYNDIDYYLPIPESELNSNYLLKQSSGY